jgi:hypothetical protein
MKADEVKKAIAEVLGKPPSEIKDNDVVAADQCHKLSWALFWKGYRSNRVGFADQDHSVEEICECYALVEND